MSAYAAASSYLALLSDLALKRMVDQAPRGRPGMGGTSVTLEVEGVRVFVKQVPVTGRELLPGSVRSTANLFGLPGSAGPWCACPPTACGRSPAPTG
jgi:hypothetical protein